MQTADMTPPAVSLGGRRRHRLQPCGLVRFCSPVPFVVTQYTAKLDDTV